MSKFELNTEAIQLSASLIHWDKDALGYAVAQIDSLKIMTSDLASLAYADFKQWCWQNKVKLISCRLAENRLEESFFLEKNEFKFIEMVLHPKIDRLGDLELQPDDLNITEASALDMPTLDAIAKTAFNTERFHVDPRIDSKLGDLRYARWVANTPQHPRQELLKIVDNQIIVGLFIIEAINPNLIYWHLTAINPQYQGMGYGKRVWNSMMRYHQKQGFSGIRTTIAARNYRVLNLYSSLNFRFSAPEMTFHYVEGT
jgi:RimJ/RimL family protein N-acetyltransferase